MNRRYSVVAFAISFVLSLGCRDRESEPESPKVRQQQQQSPPKAPEAPLGKSVPKQGEEAFRFPAARRLVAIGDVHGDLEATRAALRLAGAVDASDRWIGGKLVLVQTGDQLDRGDAERKIVELFESLAKQAEAAGGRVHALNGNHETMNVQGDFRYVTEAGLKFGAVSPASPLSGSVPDKFKVRAQAFLPGGAYARLLSKRSLVLVVGDSAFAHGGILPSHIAYGLDRLNREASAWMRGDASTPPALVTSPDGPVWTRRYGGTENAQVCKMAQQVLDRLRVRRIVVGHTVQKEGVTSICNQSVWRIDVGLAAHYGDRPVSVLEVTPDGARPLTARSDQGGVPR